MATATATHALSSTLPTADDPAGGSVWRAPLVPVALAATAGILLGRYADVPLVPCLAVAAAGLIGWFRLRNRPAPLPLACLGMTVLALGAGYYHYRHDFYPPDDIGNVATPEPRPVHLRGVLEEEPFRPPPEANRDLRSVAGTPRTVTVLAVTEVQHDMVWLPASGLAHLEAAGPLEEIHAGDEVDVIGRLVAPQEPGNPGEFDYAAHLRDQGIRAEVIVEKTAGGVVRLAEGWSHSPRGWLALAKGWGQRALDEYLPPEQSGLAQALLLGRGAPLARADWDRYVRAGVVHVLVVSGLHMAVLAWLLWCLLGLLGVRRRYGACVVATLLVLYALMTGAGMPVRRAAAGVGVVCGGVVLRRRDLVANTLALAWLVVAVLNPADLFAIGCQLSFLAVIVLNWGASRWLRRKVDPLEKLLEESRPAWQRHALGTGRFVLGCYLATGAVWLAETPLLAADVHVVSPVALLLGPPLMFLALVALVSGFALLAAAAVAPPLAPLPAWLTGLSLSACDGLVASSLKVPGSSWYVSDVPPWWLWVFYAGLLGLLWIQPLRQRWRWAVLAGLAWLCVGLVAVLHRPASDELRCTFLAVGHGGCAVLETPDGRVLLYDTGSLAGPDVTRRQIAPFLWSRGIRRVDEVLLSHADLDHFNGLPDLMERFAVGQVTCTPTFSEKPTAGVHRVMQELKDRGMNVRIVRAGDRLTAGDVQMEVLHPPPQGPEGNENARSLVLLVRHAGHAILLTGDLEGPGLERVLTLPPENVDVLMAPHHGSRAANTPDLADWSRPRVVVSCQGPPPGPDRRGDVYAGRGVEFLGTWPHGAVTVRSHRTGLIVETYRTRQRFAVHPEPRPAAPP